MAALSHVLIYGGSGFVGTCILGALQEQKLHVTNGKARIQNFEDVRREVQEVNPTHIICAAGLKGTPNIDWFEKSENTDEGFLVNVKAPVEMAKLCVELKIHFTLISSGMIYDYDEAHAEGSGIGFKETDPANYEKLVYCKLRVELEKQLEPYLANTLVIRIHCPVSKFQSPANLLTKISNFPKVHQQPQSMSLLDDLCPLLVDMSQKGTSGIFNFTSPGCVSPDQILKIYKETVNPNHQWEITGPPTNRCAFYLDTTKLEALYPGKRVDVTDGIKAIFSSWAANK